jgi:nucleoside-diphosphate-sugar epimerase
MSLSSLNKILITGAKGGIGKFLVKFLAGKGYSVIRFTDDLNKTRRLPPCSLIIHCAGRKPKEGIEVDDFIYSNVTANLNLANLARNIPVVYLSTMAVYVANSYGVTKLLGELILKEKQKNTTVIRLPKIIKGKSDGDITINFNELGERVIEVINSLSVTD